MAEHLALVLKSVRFQDPSKIVTFFSRTEGLKTGFARGATSRDNRFGAALEPLTLCRITGRNHGVGSLYRIHHSSIVDPFRSIRGDFNLLVWSGMIVRFLLGFLPPDHPEPELFSLAVSSLSEFCEKSTPPDLVWSRFAINSLALLGYRITLTDCTRCHRSILGEKIAYRSSDGTIVCNRCFGRETASDWIMTSGDVLDRLCRHFEGEHVDSGPELGAKTREFLDSVIAAHLPRWIPIGELSFLNLSQDA